MILSLAACGSSEGRESGAETENSSVVSTESGGNTATQAPESTADAKTPSETNAASEFTKKEWNKAEKFTFDYDNIVLLNADDYNVSFTKLKYREYNKNEGSVFCLAPIVEVTNNMDEELSCSVYYSAGEGSSIRWNVGAGSSEGNGPLIKADDWNGFVGETEDCLLGAGWVEIRTQEDELVDIVAFDLYVSESAPVKNVSVGMAATASLMKERYSVLYHAENEVISVDIIDVSVRADSSINSITYIATNLSDHALHTTDEQNSLRVFTTEMITEKYDTHKPGESWIETAFVYNTGKTGITIYNEALQHVSLIELEITGSAQEGSAAQFKEVYNLCNTSALAFAEISKVKPIFTAENEALRVDLLGSAIDYRYNVGDSPYYLGETVTAVTNLSDQMLYFRGNGSDSNVALAPGQVLYSLDNFSSGEEPEESDWNPIDVTAYADENLEERAVEMRFSGKSVYDLVANKVGYSDVELLINTIHTEALTGIYYSFYSDFEIAQTEYYTITLRSMNRYQNDDGTWKVVADVAWTNTSGSRYVPYDPGKQGAGYDPGRDWIDPEESVFYTFEFNGSDEENLTGAFSMTVSGYNWNGSNASKLFEDTVTFTLRFDKKNPVM